MIVRVPGDKSISQRALILASLAHGESRLGGLLSGGDAASTAGALRTLGAAIPDGPAGSGEIRVSGVGLSGFASPDRPLDLANSGTGARLLLGVLAGMELTATLTGDASLRRRPMRRVTEPLRAMGARFVASGRPDRLPLTVHGAHPLRPLEWESPVASAQVKSSLLLAGLTGAAFVLLSEPGRSRDHTERMLSALGCPILSHPREGRWHVELRDPPSALSALDLRVPGDISSAAFLVVLAVLGGAGEGVEIPGVGLNPTRIGFLDVLTRSGARVTASVEEDRTGEPVGTLTAEAGALSAFEVGGTEIPGLIDEIPVLAAAASRAEGVSRITGAAELRHKESDRIRSLVENLRAVGVQAEELSDGLEIEGTAAPLEGRVRTHGDHRIAMAFGVLSRVSGGRIEVDDPGAADVSFPGFWALLEEVAGRGRDRRGSLPRKGAGAPIGAGTPGAGASPEREGSVITIDGPAGSGKSTTAREVARRLGFRHLDSGALYRALTFALLEAGIAPERWAALGEEDFESLDVRVEPSGAGIEVRLGSRLLGNELRSEEVTAHVSELARLPAARRCLLGLQRRARSRGGLVADGRDMGTVVFPDAELKVFLVADLGERARRRLHERGIDDPAPEDLEREARELGRRDDTDSRRAHSPLRVPEGAFELDTTRMSFDEQVEAIVERARRLTPS